MTQGTATFQQLLTPFTFPSGIEIKNRIIMAPMTNYSSNPDGTPSDDEVMFYVRRAQGGVGMVVTACTYSIPGGKGFPGEFAAYSDEFIPGLREMATRIRDAGATAVLQIFHAGRKSPAKLVPNGDVVSASDVANPEGPNPGVSPRPLLDSEIRDIIQSFGDATRRAIEAGFDGVEIHGANTYLIQQFFSGHTNLRTDEWGGNLTKRMAFPLAIVREVQQTVKQYAKTPFLVGYRFSPEEPEENGITMDDTLSLVDVLADQALDYLHVSQMNFDSSSHRGGDAKVSRLAQIVGKAGGRVPVMAVGSIHTPEDAVVATQFGAELVAMGRELIVEPDWVKKVAENRVEEIRTTMTRNDQAALALPTPLWNSIMNAPGWLPVVD